MVGLFEPVCAPWKVGGIPDDFSFGELPPDWERMGPYLEKAMSRVPITIEVGIRKFFCGPESFTADLQPVVGEAPELKNYFVAAGLNSIGILTGGGLGRALAHWIVDGRPDIDVTGFNIDRLHTYQANPEYRATRTVESLGTVYQCHYPTKSMQTARGAKTLRLPRPARRAARVLPRRQRLGGRGLVRPRGRRAGRRGAVMGPAELVPVLGGRAPGGARGRDRHGHVVHGEVPGAGPRRRAPPRPDLGQQRRRRARRHHLHAVAQRGRHARGRPDRHQARRRQLLGGRLGHRASPRADLDAPPRRRRPRLRHRRDVRATRSSTSRVRARASCCSR